MRTNLRLKLGFLSIIFERSDMCRIYLHELNKSLLLLLNTMLTVKTIVKLRNRRPGENVSEGNQSALNILCELSNILFNNISLRSCLDKTIYLIVLQN